MTSRTTYGLLELVTTIAGLYFAGILAEPGADVATAKRPGKARTGPTGAPTLSMLTRRP